MKKISIGIALLVIGVAVWYFIGKPYEYVVNFKAKTSAGTIDQSIKSWNLQQKDYTDILKVDDGLLQYLNHGDSLYEYRWEITPLHDSLTQVAVKVTDKEHAFKNKLAVLTPGSVIEKNATETVSSFYELLNAHIKKFKVTIEGKAQTPAAYVAYIPLSGLQIEKAKGMMANYGYLSSMMANNSVELDGTPFIEVESWDRSTDSIAFNFCFPVKNIGNLPTIKDIKYKRITAQNAIKAVYNGNYITSDRAWYALLDYAENNDIVVIPKPIEVFYNNPNMGGNEIQWKAEIFMPIAE